MGRKLILVVEDDAAVREAIVMTLEMSGYDIIEAANGKVALGELEKRNPDLILLDLMMPIMDGWEFSRIVKNDARWNDIPVIIVSADRDLANKANAIGALTHINKPFDVIQLVDTLSNHLQSA